MGLCLGPENTASQLGDKGLEDTMTRNNIRKENANIFGEGKEGWKNLNQQMMEGETT